MARLATTQYIYGTTLATGVYSSTMANSDLRWERTEATNFGLDFGLFKNVIFGSVEYYDMTTKDLLLNRSLPRIIGYTSVAANLGELGNKLAVEPLILLFNNPNKSIQVRHAKEFLLRRLSNIPPCLFPKHLI